MSSNYRGKRLYAGRLFAGRLFGPLRAATATQASVGPPPRRVRFGRIARREDEDDLLLILAAQIAAGQIH